MPELDGFCLAFKGAFIGQTVKLPDLYLDLAGVVIIYNYIYTSLYHYLVIYYILLDYCKISICPIVMNHSQVQSMFRSKGSLKRIRSKFQGPKYVVFIPYIHLHPPWFLWGRA